MKKFQVRNGFIPADGGHASLIEISKWPWLFAADHSQNIASCVAPLLHRHGRDSRQGFSSLMRKICQVANHLHFRMPRNGEVIVYNNSATMVNRYAKRFSNERRKIASRPDFHAARNKFAVHLYTFFGNVGSACVRAHFYAKLEQLFSRALGQIRWIRSEQAWRAFNKDDARLRWIDVAKVFGERVARDLCDRTGHFNAGRATTDDNERHRRLACCFVSNSFRVFKR